MNDILPFDSLMGFILNGVKNLEMLWQPVLHGHWHCTLAIHTAPGTGKTQPGGAVGAAQNEPHPDPGLAGEKFGHGVIAGK